MVKRYLSTTFLTVLFCATLFPVRAMAETRTSATRAQVLLIVTDSENRIIENISVREEVHSENGVESANEYTFTENPAYVPVTTDPTESSSLSIHKLTVGKAGYMPCEPIEFSDADFWKNYSSPLRFLGTIKAFLYAPTERKMEAVRMAAKSVFVYTVTLKTYEPVATSP